ncbi:MAG: hypothetical protein QOF50_191 [Gaiellaceae bacterium]|nr:hypothetical protein [Gaiellaceae bacterium]
MRGEVGRLPAGIGLSATSGVDPTLSRVASELARRRTQVRCWSQADWKRHVSELARAYPRMSKLGPWRAYTSTTLAEINLSPAVCAELHKIGHRRVSVWRDRSPDALAWSVEALAHEAQHASGILSEVQAECYGMQTAPTAAMLLGRTSAEGEYLARRYWKRWYAWLKPPYFSSECRNGGPLDLRPDRDVWP